MEYQVGKGRFFYFGSWSLKELDRLKRNASVGDVVVRVPEPIRVLSKLPSIFSSWHRSLRHQHGDDGLGQPDQKVTDY